MSERQTNRLFEGTIRKGGDPILKQVCELVDLGTDKLAFLAELRVVAEKYRNGDELAAGLAAPQIGYAKRAIVTNVEPDGRGGRKVRLFINPWIAEFDGESLEVEGCLSYPGVKKVIRRHRFIRLKWINLQGIPQEGCFEGFHARVIQHEVDHLDGICRVGDDSLADGELPPPAKAPPKSALAGVVALAAIAGLGAGR